MPRRLGRSGTRQVATGTLLVTIAFAAAPAMVHAAGCPDTEAAPVFSQWKDPDLYSLAPGGAFEGDTGWMRTGDATLHPENNPFGLSGPGSRSLRLRGGGQATSPPVCVSDRHPFLRFTVHALGNGKPKDLRIEALWDDENGSNTALLATENSKKFKDWKPSNKIPLGSELPLKTGQPLHVRLKFSLGDSDGDWLVDDVYIDPRASR